MAEAFRRLSAPARDTPARRADLLRHAPALTLALFLVPIGAGLLGTWLPAFGYLPALGGTEFSAAPWQALFAHPALPSAVRVTLISGLAASIASLALVIAFLATCHQTRLYRGLRRILAPVLAVPHVAIAIGLAFLIAPSGWLARLVSPWLTGWDTPPDVAIVQDPNGLALALGLIAKEVPYLLLMTMAALGQAQSAERMAIARSLGYRPMTGWLKTVLPAVYGQIRLPVYAVIAYSLSVVDMAMVLGPTTPPPLAVLVFQWFNDPDLTMRFLAAAGAVLQLGLVIAVIALWNLLERAVMRLGRRWIVAGARGGSGQVPRGIAAGAMSLVFATAALSVFLLGLWSVAGRWRYPDAFPGSVMFDTWMRQSGGLTWSTGTTLSTGLAAAAIALTLVLACLENERRHDLRASHRALWLLYTPLLVPQVAFLFGCQVIAVRLGIDGAWITLVWSHVLFVLPYVFLSLADPYRALDERYARAAMCLGATPNRVFWRIKLPMLLRPILIAFSIGFAVSVAQYLPTLFAGGGRFATLTTEAVTLSGGGDRRVMGVYAFLQAALPLLVFALAIAIPAWAFRHRQALRRAA
jgi:putative thiamine transport system permease protein